MSEQTYLAIVDGTVGYVLDIYPVERTRNLARYGERVIGEFPSISEAKTALYAHMRAICEANSLTHWWGTSNSTE